MPPTTPPETERQIVIAGQAVAYRLRRTARKTIGLSIDRRGLRVGAPSRARLGDIEALIREHGQWVLDKLDSWRNRPPPEATRIEHGSIVSVLGQALTVAVTAAPRTRVCFEANALHLALPPTVDVHTVLEKALREKARQVFAERLAHYAVRLSVPPPPLRLSSARTRWGSCNGRGHIALNWRLVWMPLPIVDYVVAHELAHLKEMNHSPRFWAVVEQLCPDWRALRLELRRLGREIPVL